MADLNARIDQLAELMDEFRLGEAEWADGGVRIAFKRRPPAPPTLVAAGAAAPVEAVAPEPAAAPEAPAAPAVAGTPVSSPMHGIYYASPSPSAPAFVKEGDTVQAGQVVALIEAMKVFNEITAPVSGTVSKLAAANGAMVQPGEPLLYIS